jgi:hypothetical protein
MATGTVLEHTRLGLSSPFAQSVLRAITESWSALSRNEWLRHVRGRLRVLAELPVGWDGYGAPRIPLETTLFAQQIVQDLWTRRLPAPAISAMSSGGIMVEWAGNGHELSVEIHGPYETTFLFERAGSEEPEEGAVGSDISRLQGYVAELVSPAAVAVAI